MVGTLSQLVTLVSYGNAYLRGWEIGSFYPSNSTFQFCNTVEFLLLKPAKSGFTEELLADSPLRWLEILKSKNCTLLKLSHLLTQKPEAPDHKLVAFVGGGGRWLIESVYKIDADYWEARWQVTNQNARDKRIWRVSYGAIAWNTKRSTDAPSDLANVHRRLEQILVQICGFAQKHKLDNFATCFQNGIDCLNSNQNLEKTYHKVLVPPGWYSTQAEQLLAAAANAWVFGGMGSWNDLGFEGDEKKIYEDLSAKLYSLINESIEAAVNSKP
jgi:hypothetical protein